VTVSTSGSHTITSSAVDNAGNVSVAGSTQFTIDKTAPKVSKTVPANGASNVLIGSSIVITFSEPVAAGSAYNNIAFKKGSTTVSTTKTISGNTLTIKPTAAMAKSASFTVSIPANGIVDQAGNPMAALYSFSFKTGTR
jgi:hypothetical protein